MMICWILLLLIFTSRVSVVTVTQSSYQAEENHNITLEWRFTPTTDNNSNIYVYCDLQTDDKHSQTRLYILDHGDESQGEQFSGQVQCDKDVLREGRLRLHVSRLRTEDSGLYMCRVLTDNDVSTDECRLNVTAADDQPQPERPTEEPEPQSQGRISLYVGLGAALLASCLLCCFLVYFIRKKQSVRETDNQASLGSRGFPL